MQIELNVNDLKATIFLELLEVFKKDNLVKDYKVVREFNRYEEELMDDLKNLHLSIKDEGDKTGKFIEIDDFR